MNCQQQNIFNYRNSYARIWHGNAGEPIGIKTKLGWVLFGGKGCLKRALIDKLLSSPTEILTKFEEMFWEVESDSTESPLDPKLLPSDEERSLEIFKQTTTKKQCKYKVGILWKDNNPSLPNNSTLAIARVIKITAKNTVISPIFLVWKFCGKAQFSYTANRPKLCGNCAFPQNFHSRKLGELMVFYAVLAMSFSYLISLWKFIQLRVSCNSFYGICILPILHVFVL